MEKVTSTKLTRRNLPGQIRLALKSGQARKAEDMVVLDLRNISSFTDYFLIMHGNSSRQNAALCDALEQDLKAGGVRLLSVEGRVNAEWILMDYGDFIVHVFSPAARAYYSLEKLWGDAPTLAVKPARIPKTPPGPRVT